MRSYLAETALLPQGWAENVRIEVGPSGNIADVRPATDDRAAEHIRGFVIPGIGKLVVRAYKARKGRNPQTGAEIRIPARKRLKFVIAKAAKDAVFGA